MWYPRQGQMDRISLITGTEDEEKRVQCKYVEINAGKVLLFPRKGI